MIIERCREIQPLLYRVIESEAAPDEAITVGRHLADCTACKILLARKRRLAQMLEDDLPELSVGEDFVDQVMNTLPEGPPPGERRRRRRRGLKLAALAGLMTGGLLYFTRGLAASPHLESGLALPQFDLVRDSGPEGWIALLRWAWTAVESLAAGLPTAAWPAVTISLGLATVGLLAFATASASAVCAAAAGSVLRRRPGTNA